MTGVTEDVEDILAEAAKYEIICTAT